MADAASDYVVKPPPAKAAVADEYVVKPPAKAAAEPASDYVVKPPAAAAPKEAPGFPGVDRADLPPLQRRRMEREESPPLFDPFYQTIQAGVGAAKDLKANVDKVLGGGPPEELMKRFEEGRKGWKAQFADDLDRGVAMAKALFDALALAGAPVTGVARATLGDLMAQLPGMTREKAYEAVDTALMGIAPKGGLKGGFQTGAKTAAAEAPKPPAEAPGAPPAQIAGPVAPETPALPKPVAETPPVTPAQPAALPKPAEPTPAEVAPPIDPAKPAAAPAETASLPAQPAAVPGATSPGPPGARPPATQAAPGSSTTPPVAAPPGGQPPAPPGGSPPGGAAGGGGQWWQQPQAPVAPGQAKTLGDRFVDGLKYIFAPELRGPGGRRAEDLIRGNVGSGNRASAQAGAELEQYRPLIAKHMPEFEGYIQAMRGAGGQPQVMPPNPPALLDMLNYVEGRSKGAKLRDPELQPLADALRDIYQKRRAEIQNSPSLRNASFIEDYFTHLWKDRKAAESVMRGGKQGSGANLKERRIPTIEEGLAKGLDPMSLDPIEMTLAYVTNMDRFIAVNRVHDMDRAMPAGMRYIKYFQPGSRAVPPGWVELKGRLADKRTPVGTLKAYAPEDFALVYNRFVQRRFGEEPVWGNIAMTAARAANGLTYLELGLNGFHAFTEVVGTMASSLARGMAQISRGQVGKGVISIAKANPVSAVRDAFGSGKKMQDQFLGLSDHGPLFRKIADLGEKANIRVTSRQDIFKSSAMSDYWTAWKRGTLGSEMRAAKQDIKDSPVIGSGRQLMRTIGRAMDTVAHPLFDVMIPRMKSSVYYRDMAAWLEKNPGASEAESVAAARKIWDVVDDRFGEMVQDNLFWNQTFKGGLQLLLRSASWNIGIGRLAGGGIGEVAGKAAELKRGGSRALTQGQGATPAQHKPPMARASYLAALPITYATINAVMTYLHTGEGPKEWRDLISYRTGGTTPLGGEERVLPPGHTSEILGFANSPLHEVGNKIATFWKLMTEMATDEDYRTLPIYEGSDFAQEEGAPSWFTAMVKHIAKAAESMSIKNMLKKPNEDSKISLLERAIGVRPAPAWVTDPEDVHDAEQRRMMIKERAKHRSDERLENR